MLGMNNVLSKTELAALTVRLQAPLVVHDILHNDGEFNDDTQYALHEIISEYKPDAALLCIALSMQKIASIYANASPIMGVVATECGKIIEEYGPIWLNYAYEADFAGDNKIENPSFTLNPADIADLLDHVAEDLEGISELLELASDFLKLKSPQAARMCDIFKIQAISHAMIAEEFMRTYHLSDEEFAAQHEMSQQDDQDDKTGAEATTEAKSKSKKPSQNIRVEQSNVVHFSDHISSDRLN